MNNIESLNSILEQQRVQIDLILTEQKKVRKDVTVRDWDNLEAHIASLNVLSAQFQILEEKRKRLYEAANEEAGGKDVLLGNPLMHMVHQKLVASKIENDALNNYVSVTQKFLQGVFDNVIPQRRNTLYSRKGQLIKTAPESLLLNTLS